MPSASLSERLSRAWQRHPLNVFIRHRRQLSFYRQFHALLRAGTPLTTAFAQLAKYADDDGLSKALRVVSADIERGMTMAQAMSRHSAHFADTNVELIAFAEEAGTLDTVLDQLVNHLDSMQKLRWRAIFMSLWPMYLLAGVIFVGPLLGAASHVKSASDVGAFYLSSVARNLLLAGSVVLGLISLPLLIAAAGLETPWDSLKRRLPGVRGTVSDAYAARLTMALGLAFDAGLELRRAITLAVKATGSPSVLASLPRLEAVLQRGGSLADAVEQLELLDKSSLGVLAVGERTGTLPKSLSKLSEELNDSAMRRLRALLLVVLIVAVVVVLSTAVLSLLGALFGPVKHFYDAAGSGDIDGMGR